MDLTKYAPKKPLMPNLFSGVTPTLKMPGLSVATPKPVTPMVSSAPAPTPTPMPAVTKASTSTTPPIVPTVPTPGGTSPSIAGVMESLKGISSSLGSLTPEKPAVPATTPLQSDISNDEKTIKSLMTPSSEELTTQEDLDKLIDSTKKGYINIENQAIPMGFITGQLSAVEKRATNLAEPLEKKLARMQAQRQASLESSKFSLERSDKKVAAEAKAKETEFTQGIETKKMEQIDKKFAEDQRQFGLTYAQNNRKIAIDEAKAATEKAATTPDPVQAKQKITFLKQTANDAMKLKDAAGRSGIRRTAEGLVVGATDYTQLESLTNTLKTNLLTLATDPSVKKFFGPQMSNADVELMMSGGTTLNPEKNKPEQMKAELTRVLDLFNRMDAALGAAGTIVTAPDGTQVELTD